MSRKDPQEVFKLTQLEEDLIDICLTLLEENARQEDTLAELRKITLII
jgi:hypothetical protein